MSHKDTVPFTVRVTTKTRFQIELLRRATGQSIKTLLEEVIAAVYQKLTQEEKAHAAQQELEHIDTGRVGRRHPRAGRARAAQHQPADDHPAGGRDAAARPKGHQSAG